MVLYNWNDPPFSVTRSPRLYTILTLSFSRSPSQNGSRKHLPFKTLCDSPQTRARGNVLGGISCVMYVSGLIKVISYRKSVMIMQAKL